MMVIELSFQCWISSTVQTFAFYKTNFSLLLTRKMEKEFEQYCDKQRAAVLAAGMLMSGYKFYTSWYTIIW